MCSTQETETPISPLFFGKKKGHMLAISLQANVGVAMPLLSCQKSGSLLQCLETWRVDSAVEIAPISQA